MILKRGTIITNKIFVNVAAYNDPLLFFTLNELITKSDNPDNLVIAIIDQNYKDQRQAIKALPYSKQIRYMYVNLIDTLGVSWARHLCYTLYNNEHYVLQIDSHTSFEPGWDTELIRQHNKLLETSAKPIVTSYPHSFQIINGEPQHNKPHGKIAMVLRPMPDEKLKPNNPMLGFRGKGIYTGETYEGCHIAGGFYFCRGDFVEEVPYDPYLYFHGEEQSLAIRAYTRGWNIYHTENMPVFHMYKERDISYNSHHWYGDFSSQRIFTNSELMVRAKRRLINLLYGDGMPGSIYGLGTVRTMDDFIKMSGIDYKNKTITDPYEGRYV